MRKIRLLIMPIIFELYKVIFWLFSLLPKKNKVVATTMRGRKYSDNPRYIFEALHEVRPDLEFVWLADDRWPYEVPTWARKVSYYGSGMFLRIYEMATAKVWINSHMWEVFVKKRKSQFFVETFHATLPLKKLYLDMPKAKRSGMSYRELIGTSNMADVFISDSKFNSELYRRAFAYQGHIFKCGYPRNDELICCKEQYRKLVREKLELNDKKIFLYAPTFRDDFERTHIVDYEVYNVDYAKLKNALECNFGGEWIILVKFHPIMQNSINEEYYFKLPFVKNVTSYVNMQELLCASDMVMTDYSSSIIDSAVAGVPGVTFCVDYEKYKNERDVYFEIAELPFPFARNNKELIDNILSFNIDEYNQRWKKFAEEIDMYEPGNASYLIARKLSDFIDKKEVVWKIER